MNITVSGYTWIWISRLMMPYTQQTGLLKGYVLLTQWRFLGGEPVGSLRSTMAWDSEERRLVRVCIVLRVWARAHVQRRSHGLNCQPTPKQTAPSLFYRLLRGWHKGKREWWGLRSASSQTSKDGVRILIIDMLWEEDRTNILGLACIYRKC